MNQFSSLTVAAVLFFGAASAKVQAAPLLIDDFNHYVESSRIQNQGEMNWSRFGLATSDGIFSDPSGGSEDRVARYLARFNQESGHVNGNVRYTWATGQDFSDYVGFSLDLRVISSLPGTKVYAQIASDGGSPTVIETLLGAELTSTTFETFSFHFTPDNLRVVQGSLSAEAVMANLKSVTFRFHNASDNSLQSIVFDQFMAQPIPEPSTLVLLAGAGLLGVRGGRLVGRR